MNKASYIQHIRKLLGNKQDKRSTDKLALQYGIVDPTQVKELTELAIVLEARQIAHSRQAISERYTRMCELYQNQVTLSHRTSQSIILQQYSTPAPIAFLAGRYILQNPNLKQYTTNTELAKKRMLFFEPSAGNGLLTIALPPEQTIVNEIDDFRYQNLRQQAFHSVMKQDASEPFNRYTRFFEGVITNPPFGSLHDTVKYGDFPIKHLDHLMALRALDTMKDSGRAAIIVGGHTAWDAQGRIQQGKNRIFLSYLYRHYHVQDIINIDGSLYSRQGTSFDIRLILVGGRKLEPEGYAPLKTKEDKAVRSFEELYTRLNLTDTSFMNIAAVENEAQARIKSLRSLDINGLEGPYHAVAEPPVKMLDTVVPDSMDYEVHSALVELKDEVGGSINTYVRGFLGYSSNQELAAALSAEQVDAVAMAIYNIEEKGQGMIIGDQTGIGKGRVAAAIIRYACKKGLKPIFITEKANLFSDMYRDLAAIGSAHLHPFIINANEDKTKVKDEEGRIVYEPLARSEQEAIFSKQQIDSPFDYVMMTYSQVASIKPTVKQQFVEAIANTNILILDESHNAGGDMSTSATARFFYGLVKKAKGVVFLSATFAKRPDNMPLYAAKTCISDASLCSELLVAAIKKGGVALQEVLSANLVAEGQMLRRERSFEGVEVSYITLDAEGAASFGVRDKEREHRAIVDRITAVLRDIIKFQTKHIMPQVSRYDAAAKMFQTNVEQRKGTKELGVSATPYFSKVFNVVNQMLFSVKAEEVADRTIQRLKQGKAPVVAFSSTMGAFLEDMQDERGMPIQDGSRINADFAEVLKRGLSGVLRYTEVDEIGKSIYKVMELSELPEEAQHEYRRISTIIEQIATGISISPIDRIKRKLEQEGYRVAEVTGRKLEVRFDNLSSNTGTVAIRRKELVNDAFRKFNNNEVDVLLINQSGSTGASAHAIVTPIVPLSQVRQRVMIVLQAELDINREVQKRGRINRTGQVYKPIYDYVNSAIPAEKRMAMMLQKKLKSLDANTTSNQRNSEALLQSDDFLNKYGDRLVVDFLLENPELNEEIGNPLNIGGEDGVELENAASRVSGRIAVLPTDEQERFYENMLERYQRQVQYLLQVGMYDLEVEAMNLQAETLDRKLAIAGKGGSKSFGGNTYLERCEVNNLKKPYTKAELEQVVLQALGDKPAEAHTQELQILLAKHVKACRQKEQQKVEELAARVIHSIGKEQKYKVLKTQEARDAYFNERLKAIESAKASELSLCYDKIENQRKYLDQFFSFFRVGEGCYYPDVTESETMIPAVFLGFKISLNKPNPFAPSAVFACFAVASSHKYFEFALSGEQGAIVAKSIALSYKLNSSEKGNMLKDWDSHIQKASSDRCVRYIYTGNLLQAYGREDSLCRLISYTTLEGRTLKGMLMPESFKPSGNSEALTKTIVPLVNALPAIKSLSLNQQLATDNGLSIMRTAKGYTLVTSSLSVQRFGYIIKNPLILQHLASKEGFQKVSSTWKGGVYSENLEQLVKAVYDAANCTVSLTDDQVELVKDSLFKEVVEQRVFPKLVELEVKLFYLLKGQAANLSGLGFINLTSSLAVFKKYYPFPISSECEQVLADMVREVQLQTNNFSTDHTISEKKLEVRNLLEREKVKPSDWVELKHSFKRSEADVVSWLAEEVLQLAQQNNQRELQLVEVEALAKIKLLQLLTI